MTLKTFNLSSKIRDEVFRLYNEKDIKEFIRLLKEELSYENCEGDYDVKLNIIGSIDKLAGDKFL